MRLLLAICMVVLPSRLKLHLGRWLLGWDVDPTAFIGRSVVLVGHLSMGPGASIGPSTSSKDLEELHLGEGASIGSRTWIVGAPGQPQRRMTRSRMPRTGAPS